MFPEKKSVAFSTLKRVPVVILKSGLSIVFRQDSEGTVVAVWRKALEGLKESGWLKKLIARYETSAGALL